MQGIEQELRAFIVENFLFGQNSNLKDEDSFLETGIIDSTGMLELINHLEERYGIAVADEEVVPENLDSIQALTAYLGRKLAQAKPAASAAN